MKNVRENQLKNCIFMELDVFTSIIEKITDGLLTIEYEDGVYMTHSQKAADTDTWWNEDILKTLSRYFDVEVTSFHSDSCEYVGVWICYKKKEHPHPRYTDNEVTIIVKNGLVQEVYGTDKTMDVRVIDLDETDAEMLEQLEDEANCIRAEWYDIWK